MFQEKFVISTAHQRQSSTYAFICNSFNFFSTFVSFRKFLRHFRCTITITSVGIHLTRIRTEVFRRPLYRMICKYTLTLYKYCIYILLYQSITTKGRYRSIYQCLELFSCTSQKSVRTNFDATIVFKIIRHDHF